MTRLPCWSCRQYPASAQSGRCQIGCDGFPRAGNGCASFDYEPGSDHAESVSGNPIAVLRASIGDKKS
jgi:hypothetical protein